MEAPAVEVGDGEAAAADGDVAGVAAVGDVEEGVLVLGGWLRGGLGHCGGI